MDKTTTRAFFEWLGSKEIYLERGDTSWVSYDDLEPLMEQFIDDYFSREAIKARYEERHGEE